MGKEDNFPDKRTAYYQPTENIKIIINGTPFFTPFFHINNCYEFKGDFTYLEDSKEYVQGSDRNGEWFGGMKIDYIEEEPLETRNTTFTKEIQSGFDLVILPTLEFELNDCKIFQYDYESKTYMPYLFDSSAKFEVKPFWVLNPSSDPVDIVGKMD